MTRRIFRNSFLIGITVLLVSSILFFAVMFSNYEQQAFERTERLRPDLLR